MSREHHNDLFVFLKQIVIAFLQSISSKNIRLNSDIINRCFILLYTRGVIGSLLCVWLKFAVLVVIHYCLLLNLNQCGFMMYLIILMRNVA